jgi:hypothetical protein
LAAVALTAKPVSHIDKVFVKDASLVMMMALGISIRPNAR